MSHTLRMENSENRNDVKTLTKETKGGVTISDKEVEEYRAYRRQKKVAEVTGAICRSVTPITFKDDIKRLTERAARFHQSAVKVAPTQLIEVKSHLLKSKVKLDCIVGGNGEITTKVKAYEAKLARKAGAQELTLVLTPSWISTCRYVELKKEIRAIKRVAKEATLKVWVDKKYPFPMLARLARLCSEMGAAYFCVPYFVGCERLRYDLFKGCRLEVSEVEAFADFKKMVGAGVERIVTSRVSEFYLEWMKEAEESVLLTAEKPPVIANSEEEKPATGTTELKFV